MLVLDTNLQANDATTQYLNCDFNAMVELQGKAFASSSLGLFMVGGDSDNGADIDAYFEPVTTDFGIANRKRLAFVYLKFHAAGNLLLTVSTDEHPTPQVYTVTVPAPGLQEVRIPIDRGLTGVWWTFQIGNDDGANFTIDEIQVLPMVLHLGRL
jgi:hypothetical protein